MGDINVSIEGEWQAMFEARRVLDRRFQRVDDNTDKMIVFKVTHLLICSECL